MSIEANKLASKYTWESFVLALYMTYIEDNFNAEFYSRVYKIDSKTNAKKHFIEQDKLNILTIPYKIDVPTCFDIEAYKSAFNLELESIEPERIYIHWYHNGRKLDYIKRTSSSTSLSGSSINIMTPLIFDLFSGFNRVYIDRDMDIGLDKIVDICRRNPMLDINTALVHYINSTYSI